MISRIKNGTIITDTLVSGKYLYFEDEKIIDITDEELPFDAEIDAEGMYISPGFIDIHTHGGGGYSFTTGSVEDILACARVHAKFGTTTIFPTASTASRETLAQYVANVRDAVRLNKPGLPQIAGSHLEAPYFAQSQRGGQHPDYIRDPDPEEYHNFLKISEGTLERITFAPELPGASELCDFLAENGIVASYGHTDAVYSEIKPLIDKGCTLACHIYSGMSLVTRRNLIRNLGAVETTYLEDSVTAEAICDGIHLPPEILKLVYKIKGPDKICLITDSITAAGVDPDDFNSGKYGNNERTFIANGVCYLKDMSAFSGSIATTDVLVRVMHKKVGIGLPECIKMMCENPAREMKLQDRGRLAAGLRSDIVLFDGDINVKKVIIGGKEPTD